MTILYELERHPKWVTHDARAMQLGMLESS